MKKFSVLILLVIAIFSSVLITEKYNKIDESTVEYNARAMIALYSHDILIYNQYKESNHKEWAEEAKDRANKTARDYNLNFERYSYIWDGNIPNDIVSSLPTIE